MPRLSEVVAEGATVRPAEALQEGLERQPDELVVFPVLSRPELGLGAEGRGAEILHRTSQKNETSDIWDIWV